MKLSTWAKKNSICYQTVLRWIKLNKMPVPYVQLPSGMILVDDLPFEKLKEKQKENK